MRTVRFNALALLAAGLLLAACSATPSSSGVPSGEPRPTSAPSGGSDSRAVAPDTYWTAASGWSAQLTLPELPGGSHAIEVTGSGSATVAPDQAQVHLGVSVTRSTAASAQTEAAKIMDKVLAAIRAVGIASNDIKTTNVSLYPVYEYRNDPSTPVVTGYRLDNGVLVTVRDLGDVAAVLDNGIAAGATSVDGVAFLISDPTNAQNRALADAYADARTKAEALAKAAGLTLGDVLLVGEAQTWVPWPVYSGRAAVPDAATPIQPGTSQVSASVSVVFAIH